MRGLIYNEARSHRLLKEVSMNRLFTLGLALGRRCFARGVRRQHSPARGRACLPATLTQIGVNSYLWRAALDTVSFARSRRPTRPAASSSPSGIQSADPTTASKVSVAILDATLRADALRVTAARQRLQNGQWVDAPVAARPCSGWRTSSSPAPATCAAAPAPADPAAQPSQSRDRAFQPHQGRRALAAGLGGTRHVPRPGRLAQAQGLLSSRCSPIHRGASTVGHARNYTMGDVLAAIGG
jgi:hypothetical protein